MDRIKELQQALERKINQISLLDYELAHAQREARAMTALLANLLQKDGRRHESQKELLK